MRTNIVLRKQKVQNDTAQHSGAAFTRSVPIRSLQSTMVYISPKHMTLLSCVHKLMSLLTAPGIVLGDGDMRKNKKCSIALPGSSRTRKD